MMKNKNKICIEVEKLVSVASGLDFSMITYLHKPLCKRY